MTDHLTETRRRLRKQRAKNPDAVALINHRWRMEWKRRAEAHGTTANPETAPGEKGDAAVQQTQHETPEGTENT